MITKDMVLRGLLRKDILTFVEDETDPICQIGKEWLYFGCGREKPEDPKEYLESLSPEAMAGAIFNALYDEGYLGNGVFSDAYRWCEVYLRSRDDEVKKPFIVDIAETNRKSVIVYAMNKEDAESEAERLLECEEIDLSRNCYDGPSFVAAPANFNALQDLDVYGEEG